MLPVMGPRKQYNAIFDMVDKMSHPILTRTKKSHLNITEWTESPIS